MSLHDAVGDPFKYPYKFHQVRAWPEDALRSSTLSGRAACRIESKYMSLAAADEVANRMNAGLGSLRVYPRRSLVRHLQTASTLLT